VASINGNRDGTVLGKSTLECRFATLGDISEARDGGSRNSLGTRAGLAATITGGVSVGILGVKTLGGEGFDVTEGRVHETTVAAHVTVVARAVYELLLSKGNELTVLAEVLTFKRGNSGEGPAGTALALVLNRGNVTLVTPVNRVWDRAVEGWEVGGTLFLAGEGGEAGTVFFVGHVSEVVDAKGETVNVLVKVVGVDVSKVILEGLELGKLMRIAFVNLVVLLLELTEELNISVESHGRSGNGAGGNSENSLHLD